jgi:Ca2+/Na+ antiporter
MCSQNENNSEKSKELRVHQFEIVALLTPIWFASSLSVDIWSAILSLFNISLEEKVFIM